MLRVVRLLLGGLLGVGGVGLSGWGGSWIAPLSWRGLVGHEGHVVLAVGVGIVAHRHLEEPGGRDTGGWVDTVHRGGRGAGGGWARGVTVKSKYDRMR